MDALCEEVLYRAGYVRYLLGRRGDLLVFRLFGYRLEALWFVVRVVVVCGSVSIRYRGLSVSLVHRVAVFEVVSRKAERRAVRNVTTQLDVICRELSDLLQR